jgi:tetratricopeptide (TPR) repeat protein
MLELEAGRFERAAERLEPEAEDAGSREMILAAVAAEELGREEEAARWYEVAGEADGYAALQAFWQGRGKEREEQMPKPEGAGEAGEAEKSDPAFVLDSPRWYRIAARLAPDESYILNQIGYHLAEQEVELDIAVELLRRAVAVSEEEEGEADPNYLDSLAWALHRRGDHEEALEVMKRCLRGAGPAAAAQPAYCYHLGAIYGALGLKGLACEELQKVALSEEPAEDDQSDEAVAWRLLREYRGQSGSGS